MASSSETNCWSRLPTKIKNEVINKVISQMRKNTTLETPLRLFVKKELVQVYKALAAYVPSYAVRLTSTDRHDELVTKVGDLVSFIVANPAAVHNEPSCPKKKRKPSPSPSSSSKKCKKKTIKRKPAMPPPAAAPVVMTPPTVSSLISMGASREIAKMALGACGPDVATCLQWIMARNSVPQGNAGDAAGTVDLSLVEIMERKGIAKEDAERALQESNNNLDNALVIYKRNKAEEDRQIEESFQLAKDTEKQKRRAVAELKRKGSFVNCNHFCGSQLIAQGSKCPSFLRLVNGLPDCEGQGSGSQQLPFHASFRACVFELLNSEQQSYQWYRSAAQSYFSTIVVPMLEKVCTNFTTFGSEKQGTLVSIHEHIKSEVQKLKSGLFSMPAQATGFVPAIFEQFVKSDNQEPDLERDGLEIL
jgi:hypothetical protein